MVRTMQSDYLKIVCNRCSVTLFGFNEIKELIAYVKTSVDECFCKLEHAVNNLSISPFARLTIIQESVERSLRAANIILLNVPENPEASDTIVTNNILSLV